jgi:hypothetical protein
MLEPSRKRVHLADYNSNTPTHRRLATEKDGIAYSTNVLMSILFVRTDLRQAPLALQQLPAELWYLIVQYSRGQFKADQDTLLPVTYTLSYDSPWVRSIRQALSNIYGFKRNILQSIPNSHPDHYLGLSLVMTKRCNNSIVCDFCFKWAFRLLDVSQKGLYADAVEGVMIREAAWEEKKLFIAKLRSEMSEDLHEISVISPTTSDDSDEDIPLSEL